MKTRRYFGTVAVTVALALILATALVAPAIGAQASATQPEVLAKTILALAGVKGGLVVHFGCGDGQLTAALRANDAYVVHGLAFDTASAENARRHIRSRKLYGPVSVEVYRGSGLPYAENLVNLLVAEDLHGLPREEALRVLAPGGVLCLQRDGRWTATTKPRPPAIDDWTHALHDESNNAVSRDTVVAPPQHLQWVAEPQNTRHHEAFSSITVVVSAGGRLFYIVDEAPTESLMLPPEWHVVARDAFNGVPLWKRPIAGWESYARPKSAGPAELSRRLVAQGDRVYVTLGLTAPLTALDAATGQTLLTYPETEGTEEVLCHDGVLYLVVGTPGARQEGRPSAPPAQRGAPFESGRVPLPPPVRTIMAVDAASGRLLWKRPQLKPLPMSLAVGGERLFWLAPEGVVCASSRTGEELWHTAREVPALRPQWSVPTLVVQGDVVLCADRRAKSGSDVDESTGKRVQAFLVHAAEPGDVVAYAVQDGHPLWNAKCAEAYCAPFDVFVNEGLVWLGQSRARQGPDFTAGYDLLTGEIKRRLSSEKAFQTTMSHHRCYRDCATARYILNGRTGVEFIDLLSGEAMRHHWVRGVCQYGVVPANGLLYVPPHACACYVEAMLTGLLALSGKGQAEPAEAADEHPREQGPAYAEAQRDDGTKAQADAAGQAAATSQSLTRTPRSPLSIPHSLTPNPSDWPTYRHDAGRSGRASTAVSAELKQAWQTRLGGRLTSPVVADGRVLLAAIDTHTVHAFDAQSGSPLWQYTAAGRIDSPPSVAAGLAVFGSADGWVYCLRASDGQLAWRYRAAPAERRMVALGQLESTWPAQGSVLIRDGAVYCAAGRSSYLDRGIWLQRLDLKTGKPLAQQRLYNRDPVTGEQPGEPVLYEMPGALPDILSCDGECVYMRHLAFDPQDLKPRKAARHLYSPAGFLHDAWWHRTYWIYGEHFYAGYIGWYFAGRETPGGRLLVMDDAAIYGFGYRPESYRATRKTAYHLFSIDRATLGPQPPTDYARANRDYPLRDVGKYHLKTQWTNNLPQLTRALVLAGPMLFAAGPPAEALESAPAHSGAKGASLCIVSATDGKTLAEYRLDALPVFDGLIAAGGRLYLSLQDGRLLCLGDAGSTPGGSELPRLASP